LEVYAGPYTPPTTLAPATLKVPAGTNATTVASTTTTTLQTTTTTLTTLQTTTTLPEPCTGLTKEKEKQINELKKPGTAIVCQRCYYDGIDDTKQVLGLNTSKYARGPSMDVNGMLYNNLEEPEDYCFRKYHDSRGDYFILNRTGGRLWAWNDEDFKKSTVRINHL